MAAQNRFLGVDLTSAETKPGACLGLDEELRLIYWGFLNRDSEILELASRYGFRLVAIDAPLSLPKGLCCLEEGCSCREEAEAKGRGCERELAKQGIPCYFTTKRSIIRAMVYRGIRLSTELKSLGCQVIEVYPYASKVFLFRGNIPKKTTPTGLNYLRQQVCRLIPNLASSVTGFSHDLCDAAIAAYTAFLYSQGKTEPCGDPEEGIIYLPFS